MKDYSLNDEEKESFILNYKIKKDEIIVNLASGKKYHMFNSLKNELKVLKKMESQLATYRTKEDDSNNKTMELQIKNYELNSFIDTLDTKIQKTKYSLITVLLVGFFASVLFSTLDAVYVVGISLPTVSYLIMGTGKLVMKCINKKMILNDIEKNLLFVQNQDDINKSINNRNIFNNTKNHTYKLIKSSVNEGNKVGVNLNIIDKLEINELKQILQNIKFEQQLEDCQDPEKIKKYK